MKVFGFAGYSGSGKTTLIERLIPLFVARGLSVSLVKHAHHDCDVDQPGKDSYRQRQAGAYEVLLGSARRWALMHELRDEPEPGLAALLARLSPCDLVLVEGYKTAPIPKLEIYRSVAGMPLLYPSDRYIIALASDANIAADLPLLDLNRPQEIAQFVLRYLDLPNSASNGT